MANRIRTGAPHPVVSIKDVDRSSMNVPEFLKQEESPRTYRPKRCGNNKDEDNCPKTLVELQVHNGKWAQHNPLFTSV